MILRKIQNNLEALYNFETDLNVEHFLTFKMERENQAVVGNPKMRECLFIKETRGEIAIGLFVDPKILESLERSDPFLRLDKGNLESLLVAVEGVSHFLYFLKRARETGALTQLELEIQAEVDKYLMASFLYFYQTGEIPSFLFSTLFENVLWDVSLSAVRLRRYQAANRFAAKFCLSLEQDYIRSKKWHATLKRARHFYHLNHWTKIRSLLP